jgi:hypothetical protein
VSTVFICLSVIKEHNEIYKTKNQFVFKAFLRLRDLLETWVFVLHVFLCWLLLLCSFNYRIRNRAFSVHGDGVGIMKILPIFCFKMSNGAEGGGGEEILRCISR